MTLISIRALVGNFKHILPLFSLFIMLSCSGKKEEAAQENKPEHRQESNSVTFTDAQFKTAGIELGSIENRVLSGTIKVNGKLDVPPQQLVSISVPMGGFIKSTDLLQGIEVQKGQVIAVLENQDYIKLQQDYLDAKSQLEYADIEYKRQQQLAKEDANALKILQQAKAQYFSLKAKTDALEQTLKLLNITPQGLAKNGIQSTIKLYAPITGYVTKVNVNIGKFVSPADVLFEIVDTGHLHALLTVYEKDVSRLKVGQHVRFMLANETKERTATVTLIGREISRERTVQIHCDIDKEDRNLLPGMFLTAFVESGGKSLPSLPEDAIVSFGGRKYIFVANGATPNEHHFKMKPIQTGVNEHGFTEVALSSGFDKSSKVVTKGAYSLLSAMKNSEEE